MNQPERFLRIALICLFGLMMATCQKQDLNSDTDFELKALSLESSITTDYLTELKGDIETMVNDGLLSRGNGNALIVKINNAIKSIAKGNMNASDGQLNAFIYATEEFISTGVIPAEEGQELISSAENAIILSDGGVLDPGDGYVYPVILVGEQLWMAEDLRATKFNDGTDIPFIFVNNSSDFENLTTPGYFWYNNDYDNYGTVYGALYNWYAVNSGKLCPSGWHVPTDAEWTTLTNYLGEDFAADKLKEAGTMHWLSPNSGTNETGFTALPGGACTGYGPFAFIGEFGHWWTATEADRSNALLRWMVNEGTMVARIPYWKSSGLSVRCLKD